MYEYKESSTTYRTCQRGTFMCCKDRSASFLSHTHVSAAVQTHNSTQNLHKYIHICIYTFNVFLQQFVLLRPFFSSLVLYHFQFRGNLVKEA